MVVPLFLVGVVREAEIDVAFLEVRFVDEDKDGPEVALLTPVGVVEAGRGVDKSSAIKCPNTTKYNYKYFRQAMLAINAAKKDIYCLTYRMTIDLPN